MKFKLEAPGGLIDIRARCENGRGMVRIKLFSSKVQRLLISIIFIISKVIEVTMSSMPSFVGWLAPLHHWLIEGGS